MSFVANNPHTLCLSHSGLASGTTTTISTSALTFAIRGKMYTTAAKTNAAVPTTDANTKKAFTPIAAGFGSVFIFGVLADGSLSVFQGTTERVDAAGLFVVSPQYSSVPNDFCPIGWLAVKVLPNAASAWTFSGSNTSGVTGVVYGWQPLMTLPDRPLIP